ncbi:MAG: hypothetical protein FJZ04_01645 [Candidatus Moranbacteria bacterium]|nr:hypothetical protein [Candidatus Moranbacteria bacterium]
MNKRLIILLSGLGVILFSYWEAQASGPELDCPSRVRAGETFQVFAAGSEWSSGVEFYWDFNDRDGKNDFLDNRGSAIPHSYGRPGTYTVTLKTLGEGETGSCQQCRIDVGNPELTGQIKIVELLPNPLGADNALAPGGEWLNLFNSGEEYVDLSGWILYDTDDAHELFLTPDNVGGADPEGLRRGQILIAPRGLVTVFRDGDNDFSLNNEGDAIRLYSGPLEMTGELQNEIIYGPTKEGKTYRRDPDTGEWEESNKVVSQAVSGGEGSGGTGEEAEEPFCPALELEGENSENINDNSEAEAGGSNSETNDDNDSGGNINPNSQDNNTGGGSADDSSPENENTNVNMDIVSDADAGEIVGGEDLQGSLGVSPDILELAGLEGQEISAINYQIPEDSNGSQLTVVSSGALEDKKKEDKKDKKKSNAGKNEKNKGTAKLTAGNTDLENSGISREETGQGETIQNGAEELDKLVDIGKEKEGANKPIIASTPAERSPWRWLYFLWGSWFFWRIILPFLILWALFYTVAQFVRRKYFS